MGFGQRSPISQIWKKQGQGATKPEAPVSHRYSNTMGNYKNN